MLSIPIGLAFIRQCIEANWDFHKIVSAWYLGFSAIIPVVAYGIWRVSWLGQKFSLVEKYYYGRGILQISKTWEWFKYAVQTSHNPQTATYFLVELGIVCLGVVAAVFTLKQYPGISLFSLAVIAFSLLSGVLISQSRYVIAAPSVFLFLGKQGKSDAFDRLFTLASVLLLAVFLILFTFRFWVG